MTVRARLYDARGDDRDLDIAHLDLKRIDDDQLAWIDIDERAEADLDAVARALELEPRIFRQLSAERQRPRLVRQPDRIALTVVAIDPNEAGNGVTTRSLDLIVGRNLVVTVHDGPLHAIDEYEDQLRDERELGLLNAGAFMTGVVDGVIRAYLREVEAIEREIDHLDSIALQSSRGHDDFLDAVVALRRRIALVRRSLTPNRDALMPLLRPDFEVHGDIVEAWPGIVDRLEQAISAVENARELLVGSFDIYMGRSAQHSNDVTTSLTLLSSITLPAIVLAGVMGMNFKIPFFENASNFNLVVGAMAVFSVGIVLVARWRRWI
jgi:magnesium transporter